MRHGDSPAELLRFLETAAEWDGAWDRLTQWSREGRWRDVMALHSAICRRANGDAFPAAADMRAHAESLAAWASSPEACDAVLAMFADASKRRLATKLPADIPQGHSWEAVRARLQGAAASLHPEAVAEVVTGFLLAGRLPEHDDFAEVTWQRLGRAGSEPAWTLPQRSGLEVRYRLGYGSGRGGATAPRAVPRGASPALADPAPIDPARLPVFKGMLTESNGKCEAVCFEPEDGLFSPTRGFVVELTRHFRPLSGARSISSLLVDPRELVAALLFLSINGGVYERPLSPARGRLAAWKTLAAITQAPADAPFTVVESAVARGSWIELRAERGWFYHPEFESGCWAFIPESGAWSTALAWTDTD